MTMIKDEALSKLAEYFGIQITYKNAWGNTVEAQDEQLIRILNLLGVPIREACEAQTYLTKCVQEKIEQKIDKVHVAWDGKCQIPLYLADKENYGSLEYSIHLEDGSTMQSEINLKKIAVKEISTYPLRFFKKTFKLPLLPMGYHQLSFNLDKQTIHSLIISAPSKMNTEKIGKEKLFGFFAPIYALHDQKNPVCGDLGTLRRWADWLAKEDAKVIATTPIFAAFLNELYEQSPYSPVSRMFLNELYLELEHAPMPKHIKTQDQIPFKEVAAYKRKIIEQEWEPEKMNDPRLQKYIARHQEAPQYALFRAYMEQQRSSWKNWPEPEKQGAIELTSKLENSFHYHLYVQWQLNEQLNALKQQLNQQGQLLYLDLPIGVHHDGFDAWKYQNLFVQQASIGSPPDPVFQQGQNWGLPPLNPLMLREQHYSYFITMLRYILPYIDILRIDHVMGFHRLFWIPEGSSAEQGVYVQYQPEEVYAILSLESHRHQVSLIGENLGTVPPETNSMMKKHALLQMHVLQYQLDSKRGIMPSSPWMAAGLNTHDMPTFLAYCQALDLQKKFAEQVFTEPQYQRERQLRKKNLLKLEQISADFPGDIFEKSVCLLADSKAQILIIQLEDLWRESQSQNTPNEESSANWCRQLAYSLEQMASSTQISTLMKEISRYRKDQHTSKPYLSPEDIYLFNEGTHYRLYEYLGAHPVIENGIKGTSFSVWAPSAHKVFVIGSFNNWDKNANPMNMIGSSGIWQTFIPEAQPNDLYKFYIESNHPHHTPEHLDPFMFYQECAPKTASIIWQSSYEWHDQEWMKNRHKYQDMNHPMSIYEMHIGSWKRVPEEDNRFLNYRELAPLLTEYLVKMQFTHVEFLPIMEHPFYGSWGYQTLGYFAPTSRYGTPDDFKFLIDYLHQHNIGVILDWVPSHFPNDAHGLAYFDGTHLYEHADVKKGFHPDWKSAIFNYGRHEVKAFLISSALFWLDKYHIDGLRVDAVASMLYLNYSRKPGEWIPNEYGGHENLEAIHFLKELNETLYRTYPDIHIFAEESTAWPGVSRPTYAGGLGFGFKWDMGWMHDTLDYFRKDPLYRRFHHHQLTFRMIYAFTENFVLSLSHDEVVYGKGSLVNKMPGNEQEQFANVRVLYAYMFALPGKKLLFMGDEYGQRSEWNHEQSLDWHVLDYAIHQGLQAWVAQLNHLYRSEAALNHYDFEQAGFEWLDTNDMDQSIYTFLRKSSDEQLILIVLNCTPIPRTAYRIGLPRTGCWKLLASSSDPKYGGTESHTPELTTEDLGSHQHPYSVQLDLPGLSAGFYKWKN